MTRELLDIGDPRPNREQIDILRRHISHCQLLMAAGWEVDQIETEQDAPASTEARIILTSPRGNAIQKTDKARILLQDEVLDASNKLIEGWTVEDIPVKADSVSPVRVIRYVGPVNDAYTIGVYALAGFVEPQ